MGELHEKFKIIIKLLELHFPFSMFHTTGDKAVPFGREYLVKIVGDRASYMTDLFLDPHSVEIMNVFAVDIRNHRFCLLVLIPLRNSKRTAKSVTKANRTINAVQPEDRKNSG